MQITGLTLTEFDQIVRDVSTGDYESNLIMHPESRDLDGKRRPRIQARVRCVTGIGPGKDCAPGSKRGYSGRRGPNACWHAYRDVLTELFNKFPDAVVTTAMAKYNGQSGFDKNYPSTYYVNVGSEMRPQYAGQVCDCE